MGAAGLSCGGEQPELADGQLDSISQGVVTDVIPDSLECDRGAVRPSWCMSAPPATIGKTHDAARFVVDGKNKPEEYAGAVTLPYTNWHVKAGGTIFAKVWRLKPQILPPGDEIPIHPVGWTNNHLQLFFQDIPFYSGDAGEVCVFVDNNRFTGPTQQGGLEDRVYCVDMMRGTPAVVYRPRVLNQNVTLQRLTESVPVTTRKCSTDSSTNSVLWCSAEMSVYLPDSAFDKPAPNLEAGIGLAIMATGLDSEPRGSMPEAITKSLTPTAPWVDRKKALTLLFGPPQGISKSYMSWNVKRSKLGPLVEDLDVVDDADVGLFLTGYQPWTSTQHDIVAVQEGWNEERMANVLEAANQFRTGSGLARFNAYGPVDFEMTAFRKVLGMVGGSILGDEGTTGGLWIYSPLPDGGKAFHSFKACKGEDCLKAKGVQWVRLMLNPPSQQNTDESCEESHTTPCPPPPSGGDYVDVFNTHLQSDNPTLCEDLLSKDHILQSIIELAATALDPEDAAALLLLKKLADNDWNCAMSDQEIRAQQLAEMRLFIESHARNSVTLQEDRPSIIMGDFNIDGQILGDEFQWMIQALGISPYTSVFGEAPTDIISPWRYDFDWDVDHGDIAQEREGEIDFVNGICGGTFIGEDVGAYNGTCDFAGKFDGNERYDYILVRPPMLPDDPRYGTAAWVAGKKEGEDPGMWFSPFPGYSSFGPPPERLSDHKPVTATIEHVRLKTPPPYHSRWNHTVGFRVASEDATNQGDGWTKKAVDPKVLRSGLRLHNGHNEWIMYEAWSTYCDDSAVNSWPSDPCMSDWSYLDNQIFGEDAVHTFYAGLYDDDDTSGDDPLYTFPGDEWPQQAIEWDPGMVRMRGYKDPSRKCGLVPDWPIVDSAPIPQSTGASPTTMTLLCSFAELPPGQQ